MDFCGFLWISMDYLWICMDFLGFHFLPQKMWAIEFLLARSMIKNHAPRLHAFAMSAPSPTGLTINKIPKGFLVLKGREKPNTTATTSVSSAGRLSIFWSTKHPTRTLWEQTVASDSQADKQPPVTKRELPIVSSVWDTDMDPHPNLRLIADKVRWIMTPNAPAYCKYTVSLEPFWTTIACLEDIMSRESTSRHSPNDHSDICKPQNSKHSHETTCHGPLRPGPSTVSWKHHDSITSVDSPPSS